MNYFKFYICLSFFFTVLVAKADEHVISLKDKAFSVKTVQAKVDDILVFKNEETDGTTHSVYSLTKGYEFDLKVQKPNEEKKLKLEKSKYKPGNMEVSCGVHPDQPSESKLVIQIK